MSRKHENNFAFLDSQNLNLGTKKDIRKNGKLLYKGWNLDFKKFRQYLRDKYRVEKAFLFIGYIKENEKLYNELRSYGYELVFKQTVKDRAGKPKGNIDAELVLYSAAIEFLNYDKAIIVSGDGDFCCLLEFLEEKGKLGKLLIPNARYASSLLRKFRPYQVNIINDKDRIEKISNKK